MSELSLMLKEARQAANRIPKNAELGLDVELQHMFSKIAAADDDKKKKAADDDKETQRAAKSKATDTDYGKDIESVGSEYGANTPESRKAMGLPDKPAEAGMLDTGFNTKEDQEAAMSGKGDMMNRYSGGAGGIFALLGSIFGGAVGGVKGAVGFGLLGGILGFVTQKMGFMPDVFNDMINKFAPDPIKARQTTDQLRATAAKSFLGKDTTEQTNIMMKLKKEGKQLTPEMQQVYTANAQKMNSPEWAAEGAAESQRQAQAQRDNEARDKQSAEAAKAGDANTAQHPEQSAQQPPVAEQPPVEQQAGPEPDMSAVMNKGLGERKPPAAITKQQPPVAEQPPVEQQAGPEPDMSRVMGMGVGAQAGANNTPTAVANNTAQHPEQYAQQAPTADPVNQQAAGPEGAINPQGMGGASQVVDNPNTQQNEHDIAVAKEKTQQLKLQKDLVAEKNKGLEIKNTPAPQQDPQQQQPVGGLFPANGGMAQKGNQMVQGARNAVSNIPNQTIGQGPSSNMPSGQAQTSGGPSQGTPGAPAQGRSQSSMTNGNNNPNQSVPQNMVSPRKKV